MRTHAHMFLIYIHAAAFCCNFLALYLYAFIVVVLFSLLMCAFYRHFRQVTFIVYYCYHWYVVGCCDGNVTFDGWMRHCGDAFVAYCCCCCCVVRFMLCVVVVVILLSLHWEISSVVNC